MPWKCVSTHFTSQFVTTSVGGGIQFVFIAPANIHKRRRQVASWGWVPRLIEMMIGRNIIEYAATRWILMDGLSGLVDGQRLSWRHNAEGGGGGKEMNLLKSDKGITFCSVRCGITLLVDRRRQLVSLPFTTLIHNLRNSVKYNHSKRIYEHT